MAQIKSKYYVYSTWNYHNLQEPKEYCRIGYPEEDSLEYDGYNLYGSKDGFTFDIYDTLEEAIIKSEFNPTHIVYELDEEDKLRIFKILEKLGYKNK